MEIQNVLDSYQPLKTALDTGKWIWANYGPGTEFAGQVLTQEIDLLVDTKWLDLAIEKGLFESTDGEFSWLKEEKVQTVTLDGARHIMWLIDQPNGICRRVARKADKMGNLSILMRRPPEE